MKNLKISPEVHKALKVYCSERSLKISAFVDRLLLEHIKENSKDGKEV